MLGSYMNTVTQIMDRGQFTNSYKFALLRSLAAFGRQPDSGETILEFEWLAEKFVEFYWPLTLRFNVRQATDPTRDPVVMGDVRTFASNHDLSPETPLKAFRRKYPMEYMALIRQVAARAFGDVIPRFHKVGGRFMKPRLYKETDDGVCIGRDVRDFLQTNHKALDLLAVGSWVRFTEKYTSAPRLYEKIQGSAKRSSLTLHRDFLTAILGENECFYCNKIITGTSHVDHLVPWSFVAEDKAWNLVLACSDCNGAKSSQTPGDVYVRKLAARNHTILEMDSAGLPVLIKRDFADWRQGGLQENVEMLIGRCRADGFGTWPKI
jgi:hypothetical protein